MLIKEGQAETSASVHEPYAVPERRAIYVLPDTNFMLHGKPIREVAPAKLGLAGPITWVFVRTVIAELDDMAHHQNARIKRRAKAALMLLDEARKGTGTAQDSATSIERYRPNPPLDYVAMGFDPHVHDERIIAEAISFRNTRPRDNVLLLSLDTGMRLHANDAGLLIAEGAADLQVTDDEDPLEAENRQLRRRLELIHAQQPRLSVSSSEGQPTECFPALTESLEANIVARLIRPEENTALPYAVGALWRETDDYIERLRRFADEVPNSIRPMWEYLGWYLNIELRLKNEGDVAAKNVRIDLMLPSKVVRAVSDRPPKPSAPRKPTRFTFDNPSIFAAMSAMKLDAHRALIGSFSRYAEPASTGPTIHADDRVSYWELGIRQKHDFALRQLRLVLTRPVPRLTIPYAIRADNAPGIHSGMLSVTLRTIDPNVAAFRVEQEILGLNGSIEGIDDGDDIEN